MRPFLSKARAWFWWVGAAHNPALGVSASNSPRELAQMLHQQVSEGLDILYKKQKGRRAAMLEESQGLLTNHASGLDR